MKPETIVQKQWSVVDMTQSRVVVEGRRRVGGGDAGRMGKQTTGARVGDQRIMAIERIASAQSGCLRLTMRASAFW